MEREQLNYYLQFAEFDKMLALQKQIEEQADVELIQKPIAQTLLVPVRDPINEGSFISGEVLTTSAIVQVNKVNGWSMVMDVNHELAVAVAIMDGAFVAGTHRQEIVELACCGKEKIEEEHLQLNAKVKATKVAFDLL
jgi:alpha-D-ribose 1-methylphosphonate 5-triphosphate synthase subunit PhnG